jgi:DNA polymerase-1
MTGDRKQLFLIDGYALIYRSYYAFIKNPLKTGSGENTGAIFGFTSFLLRILEKYAPHYWAVVLDTQKPTFRHDLFPDYKATREKMPDELRDQIPRIREILSALNVEVLELEGYEADDIIGTLSRKGVSEGLRVVIVSGDKDFCQLVGDDVVLLNPGKRNKPDEWVDESGVVEKLGVPPERVVDLLALMGDSSDNIPGVPGVGRKTAEKLIREFGDMGRLFESIQSVSSKKMREKLEKHHEDAMLSRDLVTLEADIPIEIEIEDLDRMEPDEEKVQKIFHELEFYNLLRDRKDYTKREEDQKYTIVSSYESLVEFVEEVRVSGRLCIDTETTSLDPMEAELVGISLSVREGEAYYIPLSHGEKKPFEKEKILEILRPVLESPVIEKTGQNLKYDLQVLRNAGIRLEGVSFDTMIASYLLEPDRKSHGLDFLAQEFLGLSMTSFDDVVGTGKSFADVSVEDAMKYSCEDVDYTLRLANLFSGMLTEKHFFPLFRDVEIPLITVLAEMEMTGVSIEREFFEDLSGRMEKDLEHLKNDIFTLAGEEFNINSHQQLSRILFDKLKLPTQKKTKTGFSTDSEVLEKLSGKHEMPRLILEYRELSKLKTTYIDALPRQVNPRTGRIHTSYNQVVTSTGRLSSSGPNLQNIPIRTSIGREIRKGFVPGGRDQLLLSCDYSQIELRILAHLSRDAEMLRAFEAGEDIHRQTAALVFGIPYDKVPDMLRSRAKEVNFGIIYGMGAFGLSRRLGIPIEEANAFIDDYFKRFSGVREYIDKLISQAEDNGYVTTIMGRRRYLPEINGPIRSVREFARRTAINSPIQGSAADIIKIAMIDISREFKRRNLSSKMIMQVHDELVFEVYSNELEEVKDLVREKMEGAIVLKVSLVVDSKTGSNWFECKEGS